MHHDDGPGRARRQPILTSLRAVTSIDKTTQRTYHDNLDRPSNMLYFRPSDVVQEAPYHADPTRQTMTLCVNLKGPFHAVQTPGDTMYIDLEHHLNQDYIYLPPTDLDHGLSFKLILNIQNQDFFARTDLDHELNQDCICPRQT